MPSQVDVDDPDVEAAAGELSACVVEIANERDHVCAERVKGGLQVAGEKPFILDNEDATFGWGCA
jgi:hypothetical protein